MKQSYYLYDKTGVYIGNFLAQNQKLAIEMARKKYGIKGKITAKRGPYSDDGYVYPFSEKPNKSTSTKRKMQAAKRKS